MEKKLLLRAEAINKKFSNDISRNMYYGLLDLLGAPSARQRDKLREKEFWALKDISLELFAGDILGVVGTNGSGKTTLMRMLANIYPIDTGRILGLPDLKITAIFALNAGMQSLFSGRDNIYIKGAMFGMSKQQLDEKMDFITSFSELGEKLDRPFGTYSSGMKARLSYALAMATDPDVFIIDEALAVGDSEFKAKCFDNLKQFVTQENKAVIFVSNHINKVLKVANRIIVLNKGQIVHKSHDVNEALNYYIMNSNDQLTPQQRKNKLIKIRNYEL